MKNKLIAGFCILLLLALILFLIFFSDSKVALKENEGRVFYNLEGVLIDEKLSVEDFNVISRIFSEKQLYDEPPLCPVNDNVYVSLSEDCFQISQDDCGTVYFKNEKKYFDLTDEEYEELKNILSRYGFIFPLI